MHERVRAGKGLVELQRLLRKAERAHIVGRVVPLLSKLERIRGRIGVHPKNC